MTLALARAVMAAFVLAIATACDKPQSTPAPPSPAAPSASTTPVDSLPSAAAASTATPSAAPPDAIIAQHLLVAYKGAKRAPKGMARTKAAAKSRAEEALAKIRAGTAFEDAVKAYSDDPGSAERMGSVGKFHRDQMDPAFSAAAFALGVGQVSDVVETPFGFHIIKRTQ